MSIRPLANQLNLMADLSQGKLHLTFEKHQSRRQRCCDVVNLILQRSESLLTVQNLHS